MDLIWCVKTDQEIKFSYNWLKEILKWENEWNDQKRSYSIFKDNVYIIWCNQNIDNRFVEYLEEYNRRNLNYVVVHLSDEAYEQNVDFYKVAKKVIRNYYNVDYEKNFNLITFPLGYQTGVNKIECLKKYKYSFIGQLKSDRREMLQTFFDQGTNFLYLTSQWADPKGLNTSEYSRRVSESYFTICPRGWINLDSFRICEAMECGSIPVVIYDRDGSDYFKNVFGEHPFIIGNTWQECYEIISKMKDDELDQKLKEVSYFWGIFKFDLYNRIKIFADETI